MHLSKKACVLWPLASPISVVNIFIHIACKHEVCPCQVHPALWKGVGSKVHVQAVRAGTPVHGRTPL